MNKTKSTQKAQPESGSPSFRRSLALWLASGYKAQLGASFAVAVCVTYAVLALFPSAPRAFPDPGLGLMAVFVAPFLTTAIVLLWLGRRLRARSE